MSCEMFPTTTLRGKPPLFLDTTFYNQLAATSRAPQDIRASLKLFYALIAR